MDAKAELEKAEAKLEKAKAELENAEAKLEKATPRYVNTARQRLSQAKGDDEDDQARAALQDAEEKASKQNKRYSDAVAEVDSVSQMVREVRGSVAGWQARVNALNDSESHACCAPIQFCCSGFCSRSWPSGNPYSGYVRFTPCDDPPTPSPFACRR
jgi:septation ring formation regulator EzrA